MTYLTNLGRLISRNAPTILTAFGAAGVLTTTIMAVRATPEAIRRIEVAESWIDRPLTKVEQFKAAYPVYIPSTIMGIVTISCIISANSVNVRKQAALASLYTLSEKSFQEFREKAVEQIGKGKTDKIYDAVVEDQIKHTPGSEVVILAQGEVLCFDTLSGRYFQSSAETLRKAQNDINIQCINEMYASLNEFYNKIGLPQIPMGEEVGWTTDNTMEIRFTSVLTEDNKPVLAVDYINTPKTDYFRVWG